MKYVIFRVRWLTRAAIGPILAAAILWWLFQSLRPAEFDAFASIPWAAVHTESFWSALGDHLTTTGVLTKCLASWLLIVSSLVAADVLTTNRRPGWSLVGHPTSTARGRTFRALLLIVGTPLLITAGCIALVGTGFASAVTAWRLLAVAVAIELTVLVVINKNFQAFKLYAPQLERDREVRRDRRRRRRQELNQRREQEEAKRQQLREMEAHLSELQQKITATDDEIDLLEASGADTSLVDEQIHELRLKKARLLENMQGLETSFPNRV